MEGHRAPGLFWQHDCRKDESEVRTTRVKSAPSAACADLLASLVRQYNPDEKKLKRTVKRLGGRTAPP